MSLHFFDFNGSAPSTDQDLQSVLNTAPGFGFATLPIEIQRDGTAFTASHPTFPVNAKLEAGGLVFDAGAGNGNISYSAIRINKTLGGFTTGVSFRDPTQANTLYFPNAAGDIAAVSAATASVDNTVDTVLKINVNGTDYYLLARTTP